MSAEVERGHPEMSKFGPAFPPRFLNPWVPLSIPCAGACLTGRHAAMGEKVYADATWVHRELLSHFPTSRRSKALAPARVDLGLEDSGCPRKGR